MYNCNLDVYNQIMTFYTYKTSRYQASSKKRQSSLPKASRLRGNCSTGKVRFRDHKEAVAALHKTQNARDHALFTSGESHRREKRTYYCDLCQGHHLTSWSLAVLEARGNQ